MIGVSIVFGIVAGGVGGGALGSLLGVLCNRPSEENVTGNSDIAMITGGFFGMVFGAAAGGCVAGALHKKLMASHNSAPEQAICTVAEMSEADTEQASFYVAPQSFQFS